MTDPRQAGERLYRALLRAYPKHFRSWYGDELLELFRFRRDELLATRNRLGPRFWTYIAKDVAGSAWREWRHPIAWGSPQQVDTNSGGDGMRGWSDDLRYAARRLARSPGFTATALVILVLGIGVNSTAFSVVNALLFQPPPFVQPERVVLLLQDSDGGAPTSTSYPAYVDMTEIEDVFETVSAYTIDQGFLEQDDGLVPVSVEYATASYLDVVGLAPSRGTWFDALADDPTGPPAAVLTHKMWTDRLGSDPDVLGSTVRIGGAAVTVVGVGPTTFNGGAGPATVDLWLSISAMRPTGGRAFSLTRRQDHPFTVRARLASGISVVDATAAMDRLAGELARTYPTLNAERGIAVLPVLSNRISPRVDAEIVPAAAFAMAVVVLVLLIGTLNLANLFLVRSAQRAREMAVRLALGAGRGRLVRVVLSEALLLSTLGGVGGLAIAAAAADVVGKSQFDFGLPVSLDVHLDGAVLLFTLAMSVGTGLVFGLMPALRATSRDVRASLGDDGTVTIGARRRFGLTGFLVAGQVAVSVLLLAVASVFLENLVRAQGADPGFAWENKAYVRLSIRPMALEGEAAALMYERLEERLEALPDVGRVTLAAQLPAAMRGTTTLLLGSALDGVDSPTEIHWNVVNQDYFDVMGIPILEGRTFSKDDASGPNVAIITAAMAQTYWGRTEVVGETYRSEADPDTPVEIVGVVGDASVRALGEPPTPSLYWLNSGALGVGYIVFEAESTSDRAITSVRAAIREIDNRILILGSSSLRDQLGDTLERQRMVGTMLGGLGGLALLLAVLGIYGVVSFAVSQRRHEVGIRIALGARRDSVVRLFVRDVSAVVVVGSVVGLLLSIPVVRVVALLFTGRTASPLSTAGVAVLLVVTALAATVIPALRAARTDPTNALRQE